MASTRTTKRNQSDVGICVTCKTSDGGQWIQCDACNAWHHCTCVNVDFATAKDNPWSCSICSPPEPQPSFNLGEFLQWQQAQTVAQDKRREAEDKRREAEAKERREAEDKRREAEDKRREAEAKERREEREAEARERREEREAETQRREAEEKRREAEASEREQERRERAEEHEKLVTVLADNQEKMTRLFLGASAASATDPSTSSSFVGTLPRKNEEVSVELQTLQKTMVQSNIPELTEFSGGLDKWPAFIAEYEQTRTEGQFSELQNVARLRKALKGKARGLVEGHLNFGKNATAIIEILKEVFGKDSRLLLNETESLLKLTEIEGHNDQNLFVFASKLENYILMAKEYGGTRSAQYLDQHLVISRLTQKFAKSPLFVKIQRKKAEKVDFNLEDLLVLLREATKLMEPTWSTSRPSKAVLSHQGEGVKLADEPAAHNQKEEFVCAKCRSHHPMWKCTTFKQLPWLDKYKLTKDNKVCFKCLNSTKHRANDCPSARECGTDGCTKPHNRVMHANAVDLSSFRSSMVHQESTEDSNDDSSERPDADIGCFSHLQHEALFQVVPIKIFGKNGVVSDYALLDGGSGVTMMERSLYEEAGLEGIDDVLRLRWTSNVTRTEDCKRVSVIVSGSKGKERYQLDNVYVREALALHPQTLAVKDLQARFKHLRGLPLEGMRNVRPRILIGLQHTHLLSCAKTIEGKEGEPVAMKTKLGWVVFGAATSSLVPIGCQYTTSTLLHHSMLPPSDDQLHDEVKRYFTTEAFGVQPGKQCISKDEQRALEIIDSTMKKVGNVYEIGLLWKNDEIRLADSYPMAMSRLESEEKSLTRHGRLEWKNKEIVNLLMKGYARIATEGELAEPHVRVWTAPHFVVENKNKIPAKLRNVMDVAAEYKGTSLNKNLLKGPENMAPLFAGLFRLREHAIAVNADVKEFFNRFKIAKADQQCQRFLWRDGDTSRAPTIYIHDSMMFGPMCSPSCATEIKNRHAKLFLDKYPEAADALITATYVDDVFMSQPTVERAYSVMTQAIEICAEMSADLVGIQSNSHELLQMLPMTHIKNALVAFDKVEGEDFVTKVLGLHWAPRTDYFTFVLRESEALKRSADSEFRLTKRIILSEVMAVFDPLGMVAKYTLRGKLMIQECWREGVGWDETLVGTLKDAWKGFAEVLRNIANLKIPRFYSPDVDIEATVTLVIFVDSSEVAFAAVSFFKFEDEGGNVHISQVMAKAKVAPIKPLSIPQLELQGAVLGVRMAKTIQELHTIKIAKTIFLTDSTCVLQWINSKTMKFKAFVRARIGEILETTGRDQWYHVRTLENVADEATRPNDIMLGDEDTRWYNGPTWMRKPFEEWPVEKAREKIEVESEILVHHAATPEISFKTLGQIGGRFKATWSRCCRVVSWMKRFAEATQGKKHTKVKFVTLEEFESAQKVLFKAIQQDEWKEELADLAASGKVSAGSKLLSLSPGLGPDGVIRANTRAQNVDASYGERNPAILPNKHPLVDLLIEHHHRKNLHIRDETTIADVRECAWVINVRGALRRTKANCSLCRLKKVKAVHPKMGQLPLERLNFTERAFTNVGVDCFGPIDVRQGRSTVKRYGIIFTCLTFRAVYLELLKDLSADQVIFAIRSLFARRGKAKVLFSDNGTNFVGGKRQLAKDIEETEAKLGEAVAKDLEVTWKFIPAYSPWMGGAWERLIGSIKKSLEFTLNGETPTEDVLKGALIQAELDMNRRPLTHTPISHEDSPPLTPNHFVFGGAGSEAVPPGEVEERDRYNHRNTRKAQHLSEKYRQRWLKEYLPEITRRSKWHKDTRALQVGDIVIVVEPNDNRNEWKKGRVEKIYPGPDGVVRSADVRLGDGTMKKNRSVGRLAILDIENWSSNA